MYFAKFTTLYIICISVYFLSSSSMQTAADWEQFLQRLLTAKYQESIFLCLNLDNLILYTGIHPPCIITLKYYMATLT